MKIGIIFTSYNHEEYLYDALAPWIQARHDALNGHDFVIAAVSVPFKEYKEMVIIPDSTTELLREFYNDLKIDHFIDGPQFITEAEARDKALQLLLADNVDAVILIDGDEFFTEEQIAKIFDYVTLNKWITWFSLSYKNYVFDKNTYLVDPFTPPRIFIVNSNGYRLNKVFWDNDLSYTGQVVQAGSLVMKTISYRELPTKIIPKQIANIKHLTWLSDEKSKKKCEYQKKHFGHCGYTWGENGLEFNKEFYLQKGLEFPRTMKENT